MYPNLPDLLETVLDERGLNQKQFAAMIGTTPANVSEVLSGKRGLSYREWGRWFGAFGLKLTYGTGPLGASMGFFVNREDAWDWLLKRLQRSRKPAPLRLPGEFYDVLERAGLVTQENWPRVLPQHLAPILDSRWLWREGSDTAEGLAAAVRGVFYA